MRALKTILLAAVMALPVAVFAADDGTFTINIQGPDDGNSASASQTFQAAPERIQEPPLQQETRRSGRDRARSVARQTATSLASTPAARTQTAVPAAQSQQQPAAAAPAAGAERSGAYNVRGSDTLWSIATRYLPADRSVNEFQIAASIYRNNPQAFVDGNVNRIKAGRITIPPLSEMARENPKVGSDLLARGSVAMPPLDAPKPQKPQETVPQGTSPEAVAARSQAIPTFTATETMIRNAQEQRRQERELRDEQNAAAQAAQANPKGASEADLEAAR